MSVYAIADLHGRYDLFEKVKNYLKPEDIVYVLGDCADRGEDGWKIITEVYENPQFIYLKGNHEDMLVKAMINADKVTVDERKSGFDEFYNLLCWNGGKKTYFDWIQSNKRHKWIDRLAGLPEHLTYINKKGQRVELTHAGYTPDVDDGRDLLWNRYHPCDEWPEGYEDTIIVHGHTPVQHHIRNLMDVYWYCENHKVDIDLGACRTGVTALLNLDTWESIQFFEI